MFANWLKTFVIVVFLLGIGQTVQAQNKENKEESISPPLAGEPHSESIGNDPPGPSETTGPMAPIKIGDAVEESSGNDPAGSTDVVPTSPPISGKPSEETHSNYVPPKP